MSETETMSEGSRSHQARNLAIVVGVVVVALIALLAYGGGTASNDRSRLLGQRVPEVSGTTVDGQRYNIDDARGRWVLVNFFATWCAPCIAEHPELVALEAWGEETGQLELVSIVFDDEPTRVVKLFADLGGSWPVLDRPETAVDFQIRKVPESFLISPNGLVVAHVVSGVTAEGIQAEIERS